MLIDRPQTGSTNDDARELALKGAPHGACVSAASQTGGRGRAGRSFASPTGGLYLSVVLRPSLPVGQWGCLPLLAGAASACALRERGFPVELKWPNDLMIGGSKLGGILVETRLGADPFAIVGIGMNLASAPEDVPDATCLARHGAAPARLALATAVREELLARVARLEKEGPAAVLPEVRSLCGTLGRRVAWDDGEGVAVDVDDEGGLVIERDGDWVRVLAGDVRLRTR